MHAANLNHIAAGKLDLVALLVNSFHVIDAATVAPRHQQFPVVARVVNHGMLARHDFGRAQINLHGVSAAVRVRRARAPNRRGGRVNKKIGPVGPRKLCVRLHTCCTTNLVIAVINAYLRQRGTYCQALDDGVKVVRRGHFCVVYCGL